MAGKLTCAVCGNRFDRLDKHAPGLEENFPDLRADVCPRCHNGPRGLTARAFEVGMLKNHNVKDRPGTPREESERWWCLFQGTGDLVAATIRNYVVRTGNERMARNARTME